MAYKDTHFQLRSPGMVWQGPLLKSQKLKSRGRLLWVLIQRLQRRICFQAQSGCWQDSVAWDCGTEARFSYKLSEGSCSQLLEAAHISCHMAPSSNFKAGNGEFLMHAIPLTSDFSLLLSLPSRARFKGLMGLGQAHLIISLDLTKSQLISNCYWLNVCAPPLHMLNP